MNGYLKIILSVFWPVGILKPISQASIEDLNECIDAWNNKEEREPRTFVGDSEIRKENWSNIGPHFKNYFIRWSGVLLLMIALGTVSPLAEISSATVAGAVFGTVLITITWISLVLSTVHGIFYIKYRAFLNGHEVWK